MNSPRPLRLAMAPLACCLSLAAAEATLAAPVKKSPQPVPAAVVETPAPKRSFFKRLNPFQKKETPPAAVPAPAPVKNSKKSGPQPNLAPIKPAVPAESKPPVKSIANAKILPPTPPSALMEEPKKPGFLSRLKAKLKEDPDAPTLAEKPERPADWKERWVITDESTAFFEFGPSQANGPDLRLPPGQVVKLTHTSRGWAKVELEGGRQGYIGTDQMRQASETDFAPLAVLPPRSQLAAVGSAAAQRGWSPIAPPPDLPDLPMAGGAEDALLLLPPLEFEGTELKKSSLILDPPGASPPTLKPGDSLPSAVPAPEPPVLELEQDAAPAIPVLPPPSEPVPLGDPAAPAPPPAAPAPEAPASPAPEAPTPPAPAEPAPSVPS